MSTQFIEQIQDLITRGEMSRSGLARAAGLHANSLRKLGEADWNPTADTLAKLESYLDRRGKMRAISLSRRRWQHPMRSTSWRRTGAALSASP